jgi:hypothetical protein
MGGEQTLRVALYSDVALTRSVDQSIGHRAFALFSSTYRPWTMSFEQIADKSLHPGSGGYKNVKNLTQIKPFPLVQIAFTFLR